MKFRHRERAYGNRDSEQACRFVLLGPFDDRRQLQDFPILGDVWGEFARQPDACLDLLVTPFMLQPAGTVAYVINKRYQTLKFERDKDVDGPNIAYLQGIIAARLYFKELLRVVVPLTGWWCDKNNKNSKGKVISNDLLKTYGEGPRAKQVVDFFVASAKAWHSKATQRPSAGGVVQGDTELRELTSLDRYILLAGLILWAFEQPTDTGRSRREPDDKIDTILDSKGLAENILSELKKLLDTIKDDPSKFAKESPAPGASASRTLQEDEPLVWQVSLNRTANPALAKSVPAVKADAAKFLFKVNTSGITWAIIDSGIDGAHPAFRKDAPLKKKGDTPEIRIKRSFDFRNFRRIVSLSNNIDDVRNDNVDRIMRHTGLKILGPVKKELSKEEDKKIREEVHADLLRLAEDAGRGSAAVPWHLVQKYVEIDPFTEPATNHGTHVAGIVGASKGAYEEKPGEAKGSAVAKPKRTSDVQDGMCPDIKLYDFRVLGADAQGDRVRDHRRAAVHPLPERPRQSS